MEGLGSSTLKDSRKILSINICRYHRELSKFGGTGINIISGIKCALLFFLNFFHGMNYTFEIEKVQVAGLLLFQHGTFGCLGLLQPFLSTSIFLHSSNFSVSTTDAEFEHVGFCFNVFENVKASEGCTCCSNNCFGVFYYVFFAYI